MAKCSVLYREMRFVIGEELTEAYVLAEAIGDCPIQLGGWYHKTFPASTPVLRILQSWQEGGEDPIRWDKGAPPA